LSNICGIQLIYKVKLIKKGQILKKIIILFAIFFSILISEAESQEIEANVIVNMEQLTFEARSYVNSMEFDLENYINNQKFTDLNWDGPKIPVDINIFLSGGYNKQFSAQVVFVSRRVIRGTEEQGQSVELKLLDKLWSFQYQSGGMFSYNPTRFNEFSTLIDYYMLMIIGYDMDTFGELDGSKYLDQSKQIAHMAAAMNKNGYSTNYAPGELTRYSLISEMTDPRYDGFRKLIFAYYVDGLDLMSEKKEEALKNIENTIAQMAEFKRNKLSGPSVFLQVFFDSKSMELAQLFRGESERGVWDNLIYLDPTNTMMYQDAAKGKY
jgi:hypothetical protein